MTIFHKIFFVQFFTSLLVYASLSYCFVFPYFKIHKKQVALSILALPHLFRHLGLTLLTPGIVVGKDLNQSFALSTALGDYVTLILALLALTLVKKNNLWTINLFWLYNLIGLSDILVALCKGIYYQVIFHLGPAWFIITFWVPLLIVTHLMSFFILTRKQFSTNF